MLTSSKKFFASFFQERKFFFSEEKKQKTFSAWARRGRTARFTPRRTTATLHVH
jgi:hypothetical protein